MVRFYRAEFSHSLGHNRPLEDGGYTLHLVDFVTQWDRCWWAQDRGICNQPVRNAHILPCPRLMVWRITGAVTLSEIWMFHISLSTCAATSSSAARPNVAKPSSWPSARSLWNSEPYPPSFIAQIRIRNP